MPNQQLRILLADDDLEILDFVKTNLEKNSMQVTAVDNGKDALAQATDNEFDVIILDWMMPHIDGFSVIKKLREQNVQTPIIMLSALDSTDNIVDALEHGGDDYLTKPFSVYELVARIRMLHRRYSQSASNVETTVKFQDLTIDKIAHKVYRDGKEIILQAQEYKILIFLLEQEGRAVSKSMILKHVWEYDFDPQTNIVEVHMSRLRNKLKAAGKEDIITTIRGMGYVIKGEQ